MSHFECKRDTENTYDSSYQTYTSNCCQYLLIHRKIAGLGFTRLSTRLLIIIYN